MFNHLMVLRRSLLFNYYVYVDKINYVADDIFIQEKLRVFFSETFVKDDCLYVLVNCKVFKWDTAKFRSAMKKLHNKFLLMDGKKYTDFLETIQKFGEEELNH